MYRAVVAGRPKAKHGKYSKAWGGARAKAGAKTLFPNKAPRGRTITMTTDGFELLAATMERTGLSSNDVMEACLREAAPSLDADDLLRRYASSPAATPQPSRKSR